jgi:hypothetical protein
LAKSCSKATRREVTSQNLVLVRHFLGFCAKYPRFPGDPAFTVKGFLAFAATTSFSWLMPDTFDIIGDIHGHADALRRLLRMLGYDEDDVLFRHPERRVIFVGDFVDRGPDQLAVLQIPKSMCDAGLALAVMGNHEFNALAWAEPDGNGGFLRPHTEKNAHQHKEFLAQIGKGSALHRQALRWFKSLPIWLELPGLRAIHACWNAAAQATLAASLDSSQVHPGRPPDG